MGDCYDDDDDDEQKEDGEVNILFEQNCVIQFCVLCPFAYTSLLWRQFNFLRIRRTNNVNQGLYHM